VVNFGVSGLEQTRHGMHLQTVPTAGPGLSLVAGAWVQSHSLLRDDSQDFKEGHPSASQAWTSPVRHRTHPPSLRGRGSRPEFRSRQSVVFETLSIRATSSAGIRRGSAAVRSRILVRCMVLRPLKILAER
jgi:hypothetical protein